MQLWDSIVDAVEDFSCIFHHLRFYRFTEASCFIDYIIKCSALQDQLFFPEGLLQQGQYIDFLYAHVQEQRCDNVEPASLINNRSHPIFVAVKPPTLHQDTDVTIIPSFDN